MRQIKNSSSCVIWKAMNLQYFLAQKNGVIMLNLLISLAISLLHFSLDFIERNFKMVDCVTNVNTGFAVNILCLVYDKKQDYFQQNTSWINNIHGHAAERWIWLFLCSCMA